MASQVPPQLNPVGQPLAVFDHMIARQSETLVLKEKMFDDFDINDLSGTKRMHVEGKIMSISGRKKVYDANRNYLFDIVKKHFRIHTTFSIQAQDGRELMQVKSKFAREYQFPVIAWTQMMINRLMQSLDPKLLRHSPPRKAPP